LRNIHRLRALLLPIHEEENILPHARVLPQLPQIVAQNVMELDQTFWLRMATRADVCKSEDDKVRETNQDVIQMSLMCAGSI
jgi:hypothetical protein